jgi:hypothetical protein
VTTWRLTLHRRSYTDGVAWSDTLISDLIGARSRRLEQNLNQPAQLTFTMDGRAPATALVQELQTEVIAWRGVIGASPYFRGVVAQAQDQLTEQGHTVNFTCHDYLAMLARRYLTTDLDYQTGTGYTQDIIVRGLLDRASTTMRTSAGATLMPGAWLPLYAHEVNPNGSTRAPGGPPRVRYYTAQSSIGEMIANLSAVIGGFDYDAVPAWRYAGAGGPTTADWVRIFYPQQGVTRTDPVLEYGGAIATVDRSLNSADYANYVRVLGNTPDQASPPMFSEAVNADANDVGRIPIGLWSSIDNASDVSIQSTLDDKAQGDLNRSGVLVPSYTLGLRGGFYDYGWVNMGDTVPLVIQSGRLDVNTTVRIVGMAFDIGDDGQEDVALTVGRPLTSLVDMMTAAASDINALARR